MRERVLTEHLRCSTNVRDAPFLLCSATSMVTPRPLKTDIYELVIGAKWAPKMSSSIQSDPTNDVDSLD
ncbi:unnamed protein product [Dracunculus medinensis]|uniref:Uncharacterized protein n=1 Tax=Dracunculus medinensis TaxID=318479 RepID=A0A0N4UAI0_DRAME|nr:unnamed protein product [Dracunculus medinensis]